MLDRVIEWHEDIWRLEANTHEFLEEFNLPDDQRDVVAVQIRQMCVQLQESYVKWFSCWHKWPLLLCNMNDRSFASAFCIFHELEQVFLNQRARCFLVMMKASEMSDHTLAKEFVNQLNETKEEIIAFAKGEKDFIQLPHLMKFFNQFIAIIKLHQEPVEGIFNRIDLNTNVNMKPDTILARLALLEQE